MESRFLEYALFLQCAARLFTELQAVQGAVRSAVLRYEMQAVGPNGAANALTSLSARIDVLRTSSGCG